MAVNFRTLFQRSRYSMPGRRVHSDECNGSDGMHQVERFAAGALGFVLSHDHQFRTHFLQRVCRLGEEPVSPGWSICVEPFNWADLLLEHRPSKSLVVVELKIRASLDPHQDPSKQDFDSAVNGSCAGYGWEISEASKRRGWRKLLYVTIERNISWQGPIHKSSGIACFAKNWSVLVRDGASALEEDLYDCLGYFGISAFVYRKMKNKRLAEHATEPMALLISILEQVGGIEFNSNKHRLLNDGALTVGCLGINLRREDFPKAADLTGPGDHNAGWFGYESDNGGPGLSVWFYCSDLDWKKNLCDRINAKLRAAGLDQQAAETNDGARIFCSAEDSKGDLEWFTSILDAVNS